ncbi:PREDICTED: ras-interacting protein RIP3 [Drosophila arizonae]|uniref:Ras-interacting protein RIP3 n=1 Tax=Drosophila arizonae TaxID=7263 RepID=A0ABM1NZJ6_DROAR|nr:PREDICTED: ras-interacting protein RIP3 [Drosophila arizonae]
MDDVPVKIVERYKPPPPVYQLPPTIANRLAQYRDNYYAEEQAFHYDYQLERSVLTKCQHWRRMRQQQQQARQMRLEQRKQERQRALEAKQKEMLGAVEYPSAAELSSDSDDDELAMESPTAKTAAAAVPITTTSTTSISDAESREKLKPKSMSSCNFNNILQPTILSNAATATPAVTHHKRNSSLNYADFEYNMNSTPFDNIEMKTINDLDILAQVLHQTQLTQKPLASNEAEQISEPENKNEQQQMQPELELAVTTLAETKATLDSVNFQVHCDDAQGIPAMYPTPLYNTPTQQSQQQQQQLVYPHMVYNQHYYPQQQQQQRQIYPNHNYLQHSYINGYGTPTQLPQSVMPPVNNISMLSPNTSEADLKSRSVPDILRELKTELQQAEKRRIRLYSHNEDEQQALALTQPQLPQQLSNSQQNNANIFQELTVPAQKLAQRISSMGFPLERVAKVVSLCGIDDKKIIEHLIPLGELMDLGFEETKISAALLKFNNNKDKALDYLIK